MRGAWRAFAVWFFCLMALPAFAEPVLPALYDVTGVAKGDVLNIRATASAKAAILASLPPNAKGVEVLGLSADGRWAQISTGEATGFAAARFLKRQGGADWFALKSNLRCVGAEPFWGLAVTGSAATLSTPEGPDRVMKTGARWPGADWNRTGALRLDGSAGQQGFAVIRGAECSDGMSDRSFGLGVDLFLSGKGGSQTLHGCCTLTP